MPDYTGLPTRVDYRITPDSIYLTSTQNPVSTEETDINGCNSISLPPTPLLIVPFDLGCGILEIEDQVMQ
jgi:hypothetical protein